MAIVISILLFIICIALAGIVLLQQGKSAGLSGAISGAAESYFGKNKARTMEGKFERIT
ncbi:MAG: preprotein translocase subunit SecG, partial [Firmicutes bacterium]|nr:preprotein translocase subunit SecG [Bacillota bacterium]